MPKGSQKLASAKLSTIAADRASIEAQIAALKKKLKGELTPAQKLAQEKQAKDQNWAMGPVWRAAMENDPRVKAVFVRYAGKLTTKGYDRQVLTELLGELPDAPAKEKLDGKAVEAEPAAAD